MRNLLRPGFLLAGISFLGLALSASPANAQFYEVQRLGLYGAPHTGSGGYQYSAVDLQFGIGVQVIGYSELVTGVNANNGQNTWIFDYNTNTTVQTGLTGVDFTGVDGYQSSSNIGANAAGFVFGSSDRFDGSLNPNGTSAWIYNPTSGLVSEFGLTGTGYTGSSGFRNVQASYINASSLIAGYSARISGIDTNIGSDAWVYDAVNETTTIIGLTGGVYTNLDGVNRNAPLGLNDAGLIIGQAARYDMNGSENGWDSWIANSAGVTTQIGLTGGAYIGTEGFQSSIPYIITSSGQVVGSSTRYLDVNTNNGVDSWVYTAGGGTQEIGLTGAGYIGSNGLQSSSMDFMLDSGFVAGTSNRIVDVDTNQGQNTWVYNPNTGLTTLTGFTGSGYTLDGLELSQNDYLAPNGHAAGRSQRFNEGGFAGFHTWAFDPATGISTPTGFTSAPYTNTSGQQFSINDFQNPAGIVVGNSSRFFGDTDNGQATWLYRPATGITTRTGFTSGPYTGTNGYQSSSNSMINTSGQVAGYSALILGESDFNGQSSWVYNATSGMQYQTGLTFAANTGSAGYQFSISTFQNDAGVVVGFSKRIAGISDDNGQDAWYYLPSDNITRQIIAGVPNTIHAGDDFAFSEVSLLTDSGYAFGQYTFFPTNGDPGVNHVFLYRPDVGFNDLGLLVGGGLSASGWDQLSTIIAAEDYEKIVGYGLVLGQTETDGQSAFLLSPVPEPGTVLLGLTGLAALRRLRRRA